MNSTTLVQAHYLHRFKYFTCHLDVLIDTGGWLYAIFIFPKIEIVLSPSLSKLATLKSILTMSLDTLLLHKDTSDQRIWRVSENQPHRIDVEHPRRRHRRRTELSLEKDQSSIFSIDTWSIPLQLITVLVARRKSNLVGSRHAHSRQYWVSTKCHRA
jgi:hypothetical protein